MRKRSSTMSAELRDAQSTIESIGSSMEKLLQKMSHLKGESRSLKSSLSFMDSGMKKTLSHLGKSIGYSIAGDQDKAIKSADNMNFSLLNSLPKILLNMMAGSRAVGGAVSSRNPYLVGEKGPEIFIPNQSGKILPNASMGKSPINVVMNITTPNADSFSKSQHQIITEAIVAMNRVGKNL